MSELGAVVVTGGGRGIGAATARRIGAAGHPVCVNYRTDAESAEAVASDVIAGGGRAIAVCADVTDPAAVNDLFATVDSELGSLAALINNAAIVRQQASFRDIDTDRIRRVLETNVMGVVHCTRAAVARMASDAGVTGGSIVNVSSVAARTGSPFEYTDYAASKGALDTLSTGLARELAPVGIRVNIVRPGFIDTEMHADGGEPDRVARLAPSIPMRRGGTADEVARAIHWLISAEAGYVVGACLDVTGGV